MNKTMKPTVVIDAFPESAEKYVRDCAIVVVDVLRSTTTATTAVHLGRRVFPAESTDAAFVIASKIKDPLLVGELGGNMPYGFHLTNSPVDILRTDGLYNGRPIILVSSSGTKLIKNASGAKSLYLACFRNFSAVSDHVSGRHDRVAVIGAGTRGEFRMEDQIGCAWVAERLVSTGYECGDEETSGYIKRWSGVEPGVISSGKSAKYLINSSQKHDLDFVIEHIDDLLTVPELKNGELLDSRTLSAGTE